ncbi:putative cytochrome b5 reductase [Canariomyces notabilis]|uniref:Cytochrome b5 reductase n=1 Tax=Canariomyces notabilis TaxID=2074819 RepID=A0AAN6TCA2_9PEZI|nr:putative cytochrome b5 reductase [Canariomyces arenarius]
MGATKSEVREYTAGEVAAHNNASNLWVIIHGEVFDVTSYLNDHPGGADLLLEVAGGDGSEPFDSAAHSEDAFDIMQGFRVGRLKDEGLKRKPKTVRLVAPDPATPSLRGKEQRRGFSTAMIALSLGLGSSLACLGIWWNAARFNIAVVPNPASFSFLPEWVWEAGLVRRNKGLGFTEGVLFTSAAVALTMGIALQRFMTILKFGSGARIPAHLKLPRVAQPDLLNRRGWLDPTGFQKLPLAKKELLAPNTYRFVFTLPDPNAIIGLPIGQHVSIRGAVDGKLISRSYTPVSNNADRGILELVIRCYPDGLFTNGYLKNLEVGDEVEFRGPKGGIRYQAGMCDKINMVAGGTGITPMYQLIRAICENPRDTSEVSLIYANRTEQDILLRRELDSFARRYPRNFKVFYVLDHAPAEWKGGRGFVTKEMMEEHLAPPSPGTKVFLCGPPPMVDSVKKSLGSLGYKQPGAITKPGDDILCF